MVIIQVYFRIICSAPHKLVHDIIVHNIWIYPAIINPAFIFWFYRNKPESQPFELKIFLKAKGIIMISCNKIDRSFPVIMSQNIKNNKLALEYWTAFQLNIYIRNYLAGILGFNCSGGNYFRWIDRDPDCSWRYNIQYFCGWYLDLCCLVIAVYIINYCRNIDRFLYLFHDEHLVVYSVVIFLCRKWDRQGIWFICFPFHLVDVPVGIKEHKVTDPDICSHAFHLLGVPEREGIIISVSEQYGVRRTGVQIVKCHIPSQVPTRPVMIIPVLGSHDNRNRKKAQCTCDRCCNFFSGKFWKSLKKCQYS